MILPAQNSNAFRLSAYISKPIYFLAGPPDWIQTAVRFNFFDII